MRGKESICLKQPCLVMNACSWKIMLDNNNKFIFPPKDRAILRSEKYIVYASVSNKSQPINCYSRLRNIKVVSFKLATKPLVISKTLSHYSGSLYESLKWQRYEENYNYARHPETHQHP